MLPVIWRPSGVAVSSISRTGRLLHAVKRPLPVVLIQSRSFYGGDASLYVDAMYDAWKKDPKSVHSSWDAYFRGLESSPDWLSKVEQAAKAAVGGKDFKGMVIPSPSPSGGVSASHDVVGLLQLISAYQVNGHLIADLDPLKLSAKPKVADLDPATFGFSNADLDRPINLRGWGMKEVAGLLAQADLMGNRDGNTTLRELLVILQSTYCRAMGAEFMHISDVSKRNWIREKLEQPRQPITKKEITKILERLVYADRFEHFLAQKWTTAKRFGVEGLESTIAGLKALIDEATLHGVEHVVIGMPHRGRLNVLANVMRKPLEMIFKEFAGTNIPAGDDYSVSGDVKYHLGTNCTNRYPDGRVVYLTMLANPSHLEAVDPVVAGKARAKMYNLNDSEGRKVMPLLLHGDAAFAGQGVVYETMQMSQLNGYQTGGTVHVICNNQVGFTTNPSEGRSTTYASDLGKAFQCPIFHVNADEAEEVCRVFKLVAQYRQKFHTDIIVDVIGYRRFGHNEMDQPLFTQPLMYRKISSHPPVLQHYIKKLEKDKSLTPEEIKAEIKQVETAISNAYESASTYVIPKDFWMSTPWDHAGKTFGTERKVLPSGHPYTGLSQETLKTIASALVNIPGDFKLHSQAKRVVDARKKAFETGRDIDWATAEALAFGSLLLDGCHVRLSGQDVERGTFSHRHAVFSDQETGQRYTPLDHLNAKQKFSIHNSLLSEYGVVGFELGYSLESPNQLVLWEAQFGDFANGAQIIIDNFITSGEAKWLRQSGLTLLLPHGYDGQGPEHSSCRIERFLQNADEDPDVVSVLDAEAQIKACNWQIVNCTTPANYFHALRRQLYRPFRKPLIVASPKSLLRHRLSASNVADIKEGTSFHRVIPEINPDKINEATKIRRVLMCSGKVFYELLEARQAKNVKDVAIIRIEQLCPFPFDQVAKQMKLYSNAELVWVQEEPKNMGAWYFVQDRLMTATRVLNKKEIRPGYIGRRTMASPAEGYGKVHEKEMRSIMDVAFSTKVHSYGHGRVSNDV